MKKNYLNNLTMLLRSNNLIIKIKLKKYKQIEHKSINSLFFMK